MSRPVLVIVSGYFSPLHCGHLDMIESAADRADKLVVIVNNNAQQIMKKGKLIIDEADRLRIVAALRVVDEAMIAIDEDRTVSASIESIARAHPDHRIVFANGGDRDSGAVVPESRSVRATGSRWCSTWAAPTSATPAPGSTPRWVSKAQRNRSSAGARTMSAATEPSPNHAGSHAAHHRHGDAGALPITSSAAAASSSTTATSVTCISRPSASGCRAGRGRPDAGAADGHVGETPRQGRPKVSETITATSTPCLPRGGRRGCGGPTGRCPRGAGRLSPARRWTGRCRRWRTRSRDGSRLMMSSPRRAGSAPTPARPAACGTAGRRVDRDQPVLGLGHDLLGDDHHVAVAHHAGTGDELGEVVAGADLGDALDGDDLERGHGAGALRWGRWILGCGDRRVDDHAARRPPLGSLMMVSVTTQAHGLGLDRDRRGPVGSSTTRCRRGRGSGGPRRRPTARCRARPACRSAGPLSAAPTTMGETATHASRRSRMASRTPATASSGPMETTGFDGAITTVSAPARASSTPGRAGRCRCPRSARR
jgi:cytidyltransferase-like protein